MTGATMLSSMNLHATAEDLMAHIPLGASFDRVALDGAVLTFQPGPHPYFANASAVRTTAEGLDRLIAEARKWFGDHQCASFTWFLGPTSTPTDLVAQLGARGAVLLTTGTAMVLGREPVSGPKVEIREVSSAPELATYRRIVTESEKLSDEQREALAAGNDAAWRVLQESAGTRRCYLAYDGGEPVAAGGLLLLAGGAAGVLSGGATRPSARGRGYYRALVQARFEVIRRLGGSALLVQASPMSAPILERAGFTPVAPLTILQMKIAS